MKTIIENIKKATVKQIFDQLQTVGFCKEFNGSFHTERSEGQYLVLDFIRKTSKSFAKDIAKTAYTTKISDKQAWCIAYEFDKLRSQFESYILTIA